MSEQDDLMAFVDKLYRYVNRDPNVVLTRDDLKRLRAMTGDPLRGFCRACIVAAAVKVVNKYKATERQTETPEEGSHGDTD